MSLVTRIPTNDKGLIATMTTTTTTTTTPTSTYHAEADDILNALRTAGLDMTKYKVDARFIKKTHSGDDGDDSDDFDDSDDLATQYDNWELVINSGNPMFLGFDADRIVEELRDDPEIILDSIPFFDGKCEV